MINKKVHVFGKSIPISHLFLFILMAILAFIMFAPFLWVFSASVRSYSDATSLPPKWLPPPIPLWDTRYFGKLLSPDIPFFVWMFNSLKVSTLIVVGMVFNGCIAGYAYARLRFKGKNIMFALMMLGMMVPVQVTIVPLYKIMHLIGAINTHAAIYLPSLFGAMCPGLAGAFGIFLMRQFFTTIPKEMEEAAIIDGAGTVRTFFSIMLPMSKSAIVSLAILVFTYAWNDYFTAFIMINNTNKLTLPVGILQVKQPYSTGDNVVFAAVCLAIIPVLIVFIVGQKWITESMTHVGVKG
jgi:multiple sugar transport system permease protein